MRFYLSLTLLFSYLAFPAYADATVCRPFFDSMRSHALAILHDPAMRYVQKRDALSRLFDNAVDGTWVAHFVAGAAWRTATEGERRDFVAAYRAWLPLNYVGALDEDDINNMQGIDLASFTVGGPSVFYARTRVTQKDAEPIAIDFRLEEDPPGVCHVRDFTIEGVSLLTSQREQIQTLTANGGLAAVTAQLKSIAVTKSQ